MTRSRPVGYLEGCLRICTYVQGPEIILRTHLYVQILYKYCTCTCTLHTYNTSSNDLIFQIRLALEQRPWFPSAWKAELSRAESARAHMVHPYLRARPGWWNQPTRPVSSNDKLLKSLKKALLPPTKHVCTAHTVHTYKYPFCIRPQAPPPPAVETNESEDLHTYDAKAFYTRSKTKSTYVCTFLFLCVLHLWRLKPSTPADPPQLRTTSEPKFIANLQSHSIQPHNFFVESLELTGPVKSRTISSSRAWNSLACQIRALLFVLSTSSFARSALSSELIFARPLPLAGCLFPELRTPSATDWLRYSHTSPTKPWSRQQAALHFPVHRKVVISWITSSSRRYVLNVMLFFLVSISINTTALNSLGVAMPTIWWAIKVDERLSATASRENRSRSAFRGYHHL